MGEVWIKGGLISGNWYSNGSGKLQEWDMTKVAGVTTEPIVLVSATALCYSGKKNIFHGIVPRSKFSNFLCRESNKFENHWSRDI